ncbi:protein TANC2, partial [Eurytemora carolleeae]|uniref:protein TANC2 n=1 Tax=Eurytemora carolleeae TaxID=1294199 RepID=UPI000C78FD42
LYASRVLRTDPTRVVQALNYIWEIDDTSSTSSKPPLSSQSSNPGSRSNIIPSGYRSSRPFSGSRACSAGSRAYSAGSAGQESGFQSRSSLLSLAPSLHSGPISTLGDNPLDIDYLSGVETDTESLASLSSNLSLQAPIGGQGRLGGRRYSLSRLSGEDRGSKVSLLRRSARVPGRRDVAPETRNPVPFLQYRPVQWFLKPLYFEVPQREASPVFVGRDWVFREIQEQFNSSLPTNRGILISGSPGTGKTGIILNLVERSSFGHGEPLGKEPVYSRIGSNLGSSQQNLNPQPIYSQSIYSQPNPYSSSQPSNQPSLASQVVAYHFCQIDNAVTCQIAEWIHSLAAQLSQAPQLESYHSLLSTEHDLRAKLSLTHCLSHPDSALTQGILAPLVSLQKSGKLPATNCIILIDALCDAEFHRPDYGNTLTGFIARHLPSFPTWLKIICTIRTASKQAAASLPFHHISLDNYDVDERLQKDISDYIGMRISKSRNIQTNITPSKLSRMTDENPQTRFQNHLVSSAKGSFLFVKLLLDLIEKGSVTIKSTSFNVLPETLSQIFLLEFNLRFPTTHSFKQVSDILSVCLSSLQPLTLPQLFLAVNSIYIDAEISWEDFLARYSLISDLVVKRRDESVCFFHPLLREWLMRRGEKESIKFICDPRIGHTALSLEMCRTDQSLTPELTLDLTHHILKSNIYRNKDTGIPTRDLLASWISLFSDDISLALGAERNLFNPNINLSKLLLLSGANPNQSTTYLNNAPLLCVFTKRGYVEMVSLLLEFGADVNATNSQGFSSISFACMEGNMECLRVLVEGGAKISQIDKTESCALVHAARNGHLPILEYLLSLDWNSSCPKDATLSEVAQQAAVAAASAGNLSILEFLLDMREVKVNNADTLLGETLLGAAAAAGRRDCCQALIKRGASLISTNLKEAAPLHMAAREGHWSVCELLLSEGANLEQKDVTGKTPLILAAMEGHLGVVEHFVMKKANIEVQDKDGLTPLIWACAKGKLQAVRFLLAQGADINSVDKKGRTALDLAGFQGDPDVVTLLLDHGAMMEHVDINGMRALDRAIGCGNFAAVKCFLKKGAKLGPNTWTMAAGKPEILLCLLNKLLEDGNTLYKRNKLSDAAIRYSYAYKRIPSDQEKLQKVFDQLKIHLLLNLSRCKRKMKEYREAVEHASEVIQTFPHVFEAYHTRAKAYHSDGKLDAAYSDMTQAVRLAPQNRELHRNLLSIKEEIQSPSNPLPDSMFTDPKDPDSGGSTSSGVGSSL